MKTIIFKWNPAFSSYTILRFLKDLQEASSVDDEERTSNWSVWDYDKVGPGDRFYLLKVGFGQTGLVAKGVVTSKAYQGEDWSWRDRPTWYIDYLPDIMINPDAFKLLTSSELAESIPNFDWFGGHSGLVLDDNDAEILEAMWDNYMTEQQSYFDKASDDNLFMALPKIEDGPYSLSFYKSYNDELTLALTAKIPYYDKTLTKKIRITDVARLQKKTKNASKRSLAQHLYSAYGNEADLAQLCALLYDFGINYSVSCYVHEPDDDDDD